MITLELICQWLQDASKQAGNTLEVKVWTRNGYIYLETETRVYRLSLDGGC